VLTDLYCTLTYIGFDGISTLSEEVKNPRRNILLRQSGLFIYGLFATVEIYISTCMGEWGNFPDIDTAIVFAGKAGGICFSILSMPAFVFMHRSGHRSMLGAARLLYGMGRKMQSPGSFSEY
jgi:amino acid transporter